MACAKRSIASRISPSRGASSCWWWRTIEAERLGIRELLHHDDIDIATASEGSEALEFLRTNACDCVVLDLKLPDMSGFQVLEELGKDESLSDDSGRRLHRARAVGGGRRAAALDGAQRRRRKALSCPSVCWTRRRCSCTASSASCLPKSSACSSGCTSSDEDLVGQTVLLVDDDARNIFALEQRARAPRHERA